MAETRHTPGRIKAWPGAEGDGNAPMLTDEATGAVGIAKGIRRMRGQEESAAECEANVRRLAACWNYCLGIPTEELEAKGGTA